MLSQKGLALVVVICALGGLWGQREGVAMALFLGVNSCQI